MNVANPEFHMKTRTIDPGFTTKTMNYLVNHNQVDEETATKFRKNSSMQGFLGNRGKIVKMLRALTVLDPRTEKCVGETDQERSLGCDVILHEFEDFLRRGCVK